MKTACSCTVCGSAADVRVPTLLILKDPVSWKRSHTEIFCSLDCYRIQGSLLLLSGYIRTATYPHRDIYQEPRR